MNYCNAKKILPDSLVKELQEYIQGGYLYIPSKSEKRKRWGANSGAKEYLKNRNETIRNRYKEGYEIENLATDFYLSIESIKKIIYTRDS